MNQKENTGELIDLVINTTKNVKSKFKEDIEDPEYFFWHKYIELLDEADEIKNEKDMNLVTEANVLRLLSILVPHWKEFKKQE